MHLISFPVFVLWDNECTRGQFIGIIADNRGK
jgi:hypothetical protein